MHTRCETLFDCIVAITLTACSPMVAMLIEYSAVTNVSPHSAFTPSCSCLASTWYCSFCGATNPNFRFVFWYVTLPLKTAFWPANRWHSACTAPVTAFVPSGAIEYSHGEYCLNHDCGSPTA